MSTKLKNILNELKAIREKIGAAEPKTETVFSIHQKPAKGGEKITGAKLKSLVESLDGPYLIDPKTRKPFTIHIYMPHASKEELHEAPKFHFSVCPTISAMIEGGRYDRYVQKMDASKKYAVRPKIHETKTWSAEILAELNVCLNCLKFTDYDGYKSTNSKKRQVIVTEFTLKKCFAEMRQSLPKPRFKPSNMPIGDGSDGYTKDWPIISTKLREEVNWICDCCNVKCEGKYEKYLHVHHKDGNKGNNQSYNLRVLCYLCHEALPFHGRMNSDTETKLDLITLREEQNIPKNCSNCPQP